MRRFPFLAALVLLGCAYAAPAYADTIGQVETFNVSRNYDAAGDTRVSATLRAIGSQIYIYVDDRYWNSLEGSQRSAYLDRLEMLASDFSGTIRPQSVAFWGTEATPGVDNDPRLTVLVEQLIPGSGGYFQTINSYTRDQAPESNQREMVFLSADSVNAQARDFLTHEFQHLISFNQRELGSGVADDVWLNELRSEYNITVAGYSAPYVGSTLQRRAQSFLRTPSDSLTEWPNTTTDYATATMFGHYLADRYGGAILQHTIHSREPGVRAINEWLSQRNKPERFREVFADWMAALIVNDLRDPRYGYVTTGLNTVRVVPSRTVRLDGLARTQWDLQLKDWQPDWIRMDMPSGSPPSPTLTVQVSGQSGSDWGGNYIADYTGPLQVTPWRVSGGVANIAIPTTDPSGRTLRSVTLTIANGTDEPVNSGMFEVKPVTVSATLDPNATQIIPGATTAPQPAPSSAIPKDGDLINHNGAKEVYVIWGKYRRYLVPGILELYGFQNRPVIAVNDDVFNRYTTSNYIRQVDTQPVYAVWPDGTKHHFAITAAQWDASLRDWNSIFIVNDREAAFYPTGEDITR